MKETLAKKVYEQVKDDIVNLNYGINEMLSEQMTATRYNVSKTTAREALSLLCKDGYLVKYPSRGYFIKEVGEKEFLEIVDIRLIIEMAVAEIIIEKSSDEEIKSLYNFVGTESVTRENFYEYNRNFHYQLAVLTKNQKMAGILYDLVCSISRPWSYLNFEKSAEQLQNEHKNIVDALLERNNEKVKELLKADIVPKSRLPRGLFGI